MGDLTRIYFAGAERIPGTELPDNVTGDCPHVHLTPEKARLCIDNHDAAIKHDHGPRAFCDRIVMVTQKDTNWPVWYEEYPLGRWYRYDDGTRGPMESTDLYAGEGDLAD